MLLAGRVSNRCPGAQSMAKSCAATAPHQIDRTPDGNAGCSLTRRIELVRQAGGPADDTFGLVGVVNNIFEAATALLPIATVSEVLYPPRHC
jgi:hypothetical protein